MIASNKDRGLNKKIVNIFKEYLSNPSQEIYSDIKNGIDKLDESELVKLLVEIVGRDVVNLYNDKINKVGNYAFSDCTSLTTVDLPNAESIGSSAFRDCANLTTVDLPNATSIGYNAFQNCSSLTTVDLPNATSIGDFAFSYCSKLTSIELPSLTTNILPSAFKSCSELTSLILSNDTVVHLISTTAFMSTPIESGTGYIYVPDNLVDSYKLNSNWGEIQNRIKPISELPTE